MLKHLFMILTLVTVTPLAQAFDDEALAPLIDTYAEVNSVDLVDEHYWLALSTAEDGLSADLRQSPLCQNSAGFTATTPTAIATALLMQLREGIQLGSRDPSERIALTARAEDAVQSVANAMADAAVTVCIDDTNPSYSDEYVVHFVRLNGELSFAFSMGRPD